MKMPISWVAKLVTIVDFLQWLTNATKTLADSTIKRSLIWKSIEVALELLEKVTNNAY